MGAFCRHDLIELVTWTCTVAPHVQVTLENEAVEALERSDSVEESGRLSSSLASVDDEVVEHLKAVGARRSLYQAKLEEMCDDERHPYAPEIEKLEALKEPPIDFFSQVNPDCFNVHGLPLSRPRWHPPRGNDARRRPHVPLDQDFDSPSESESSDDHVDEEMVQVRRSSKPWAEVTVPQMKAGAEMQMGQLQLQERPETTQLALPAEWCRPHCCIDHCRSLADQCSTLLESLRWQAKKPEKPAEKRGPQKLENEDPAVEELRVVRVQQLAKGAMEQNQMRAHQRAS